MHDTGDHSEMKSGHSFSIKWCYYRSRQLNPTSLSASFSRISLDALGFSLGCINSLSFPLSGDSFQLTSRGCMSACGFLVY